MLKRFVSVTAVLALLALAVAAQAASLVYGTLRQEIKAGVLGTNLNPAPFYIMDAVVDLKPMGWQFMNPLAPGGAEKVDAAYWNVGLDEDFTDYDVLLLPVSGTFPFDPDLNERLRKFVDAGGTLWIEHENANTFALGDFFIGDIGFGGGTSAPVLVVGTHPLLSRPFTLTWQDVNNLGTGNSGTFGLRTVTNAALNDLPNKNYFFSIVSSGSNSVVSAAQYGSGHIVITAESVSAGMVTAGGDGVLLISPEDLKFAYNIVNWGSEHTTFHKDPRHSGYSFSRIGGSTEKLWTYWSPGDNYSSPAMLDDMIFYVDGANVLHAFDMSFSKDRDNDGFPDDGTAAYRDQSKGAPYDEIWRVDLTQTASSPTAAYVPVGGVAVPAVFVTLVNGEARAYKAVDGSSVTLATTSGETFHPFAGSDISAPTYVDGTLYWGDGQGYLHGRDLLAYPNGAWYSPLVPSSTMGAASSPTIGYVWDEITGAVDQMVYLAHGGTASVPGEGVQGFPLRTYNEVLTTSAQDDGSGSATYQTRAGNNNTIKNDGTWKVYYVDESGTMLDAQTVTTVSLSGSSFTVGINNFVRGRPIIADYTIDTGDPNYRSRSTLDIKVAAGDSGEGVIGTPALGRNDVLYFGTSNKSLYAMSESGRRSTRALVRWRWYLDDPGVPSGIRACTPVGSPAVAEDMVYFAVSGADIGYILALKSDPLFTLSVGSPIDQTKPVTVLQRDSMNPGMEPIPITGVPESDSDEQAATYIPFMVDYQRGRINFYNFRSGADPSTDLSASQDVIVRFTPTAGGAEVEQVHPAFSTLSTYSGDTWNNLAWYMPLPAPTSSPVVMGDVLYVGCVNGDLVSLNLSNLNSQGAMNPSNTDPKYIHAADISGNPIHSTVAGSNGMLAVSTQEGLVVLHNPVTLVAEASRVAEIDSSGSPVWSCDGTVSWAQTADASGKAYYTQVVTPFNRPAAAHRAPSGGIVVADSGNNRVAWIDQGGNLLREVTGFSDPDGLLPVGEPLTLSAPNDVQVWEEVDDSGYPAYHYLITDSGNNRVVEVASVYDSGAGAYRNQLVWTTGKGKYRYVSAKRLLQDTDDFVYAVISNLGANDVQGGTILRIRYVRGTVASSASPYTMPSGITLHGPIVFDRQFRNTDRTDYEDLIVDSTAIYVVRNFGSDPVSTYTAENHRDITGHAFYPSYAQLLPNGNVLVANKATGSATGTGEVFELTWNTSQNRFDVVWSALNAHQPSSAESVAY
ncbi:MAG: PQQ-binding-like beta-propeller repeat protein [Armatimonadota bacterium]